MRPTLSLVLVLLAWVPGIGGAQSNAPPVRLAVIVGDDSAVAAADLLTVELGKTDRLQILERAEIDRVRREQGLSAANQDNLKLGQILGADGILLLETAKEGTNQFLTARLVAVKPGVAIGSFRSPWPVANVLQWAKWIPARFAPLFPKLGVLVKDAVPISVVNFRSAVRSVESQEEEPQLTALAIERLTQERQLFVLERRRTELMSEEKELQGMQESAFWNGSYLLDGVFDRDGYVKDSVTINARLTPPRVRPPVAIEIKGSRTNLAQLVNQLANEVNRLVNLAPSLEWNPQDEAKQYFEEAGWAFKWDMLNEAQAACEASWSLGRRTRDVAELRVRVYQAQAGRDRPAWAFAPSSPPNSRPDFSKFAPALTALQIYDAAFQSFLVPDATADMAWYDLGLDLLNSDSSGLHQFYFESQEARHAHQEELTGLRSLLRATAAMMGDHPAYKKLTSAKDKGFIKLRNEDSWRTWAGAFDLATIKAAQGALWCESPEQCIDLYRGLARSGDLDRFYTFLPYVKVVAWNSEDRNRPATLWRNFVQELCHSTNAGTRVDGYYLDFADAKSDHEYRERGFRFFQVTAQNAYSIVAARRDEQLMRDIEDLLGEHPRGYSASPVGDEIHRYYDHQFKQDFGCSAFVTFLESDDQFKREEFGRFSWPMHLWGGEDVLASPERVKKVLAAMDSYKERLTQKQKASPLVFDFRSFNGLQTWLKQALPPAMPAAAPPTNVVATAIVARLRALRLRGTAASSSPDNSNSLPIKPVSSNVVPVTRFWRVPTESAYEYYSMTPGCSLDGGKFREGRFWFEVFCGQNGVEMRQAFIYGVDLNGFQTETIELPLAKSAADSSDHAGKFVWAADSFEVLDGFVYCNGQGKIRRYSLRTKSWETVPVPVQGGTRLTVLDGRLFICSDDSILELNEDAKGVEVLASTRRRPPLNPLDSLADNSPVYNNLRDALVFPGPGASLSVFVKGKLYNRVKAGDDWRTGLTLPEAPGRFSVTATEGRLVVRYKSPALSKEAEWVWLLSENQSSFETALGLPAPPYRAGSAFANARFIPRPPPINSTQPPPWNFPAGIATNGGSIALDNGILWFCPDNLTVKADAKLGAILNGDAGCHALLLEFQKGEPEPRQIPLWFDLKKGTLSMDWLQTFRHYNRSDPIELKLALFRSTPQGLVIAPNTVPGFWFIPRADLDGARN